MVNLDSRLRCGQWIRVYPFPTVNNEDEHLMVNQWSWFRIPQMFAAQVTSTSWQHNLAAMADTLVFFPPRALYFTTFLFLLHLTHQWSSPKPPPPNFLPAPKNSNFHLTYILYAKSLWLLSKDGKSLLVTISLFFFLLKIFTKRNLGVNFAYVFLYIKVSEHIKGKVNNLSYPLMLILTQVGHHNLYEVPWLVVRDNNGY